MDGFVQIAGRRYDIASAELHCPAYDDSRYMFLLVMIHPEGGFAFWHVEVPLLRALDELDGQRVHIRRDGEAFDDDTLGTDYTGVDLITDLNYWKIGGRTFYWGDIQIDFRRLSDGRCQVVVLADLAEGQEFEDMAAEEGVMVEDCTVLGRAELTVWPDELDPLS